jgi:hypothetical protein
MVDVDPFLTTLYVMVDAFCKAHWPIAPHPGPQAARSRSAVRTLAIFRQGQGCGSERGCHRYASRHLRLAFPTCRRGSHATGNGTTISPPSWQAASIWCGS